MALDLSKLNKLKEQIEEKQSDSSVIYLNQIGKDNKPKEVYFLMLDVCEKHDGLFCQPEYSWFFDGERVLSPSSVGLPCSGRELWDEIQQLRSNPQIKEILKDFKSFNFSESYVFPVIELEWDGKDFVSKGLKFAVATPNMIIQINEMIQSPMADPNDWTKYIIRCHSQPKPGNQNGRNYFFEQSKKTYTLTEVELAALSEVDMVKSVKERMDTSEYCESMLRWKFEGADKPVKAGEAAKQEPAKPKSSLAAALSGKK
jgi:hypothetical protein